MHRTYENEDITVLWDSDKCRHAAKCVTGCPEVFDFNRKPWIDLKAAENKKIWETVKQCPSGALEIMYDHGIRVEYDEKGDCIRAFDGERQVGECDFRDTGDAFNIYHTEVDLEYGGKKIARRMVFRALQEAERRKKTVIPSCSYAAKIMAEKN